MDSTTVVIGTLVAYNLVLIGVGLWAKGRTHNEEDFFIAGRGLGPVVAAISYSASSCSAWTLLGMSGAAFLMGVSALWLAFGAIFGMVLAWTFVAPRLMDLSHGRRLVTMTDLLTLGTKGRWRAAITGCTVLIVVFAYTFYVSAQFQGAGSAFQQTLGLSMGTSILLGGGIIMIYTFLGGFLAVSVTDVVQGLFMAATAILLPFAALFEVGGVDGFLAGLAAVSTPDQLSWTGRNTGLLAAGFVVGAFGVALGTFGQPHLLTRFMALRDAKAMRQARILTVVWFLVVFLGMGFTGLVGHVLIPDLDNPEYVFFALSESLFPALLGAAMVAAVLSAVMSTADSQLLVGASAIVHDLGLSRRYPARTLLMSRLAIAALVGLAVWVSLTLPSTIFQRALLAWTVLGSAFGPLVLFRVAGIGLKPAGVLASILAGFGCAVLFHFNPGGFVQALTHPQFPASLPERIGSFVLAAAVLWAAREPSVSR